MGGTSTVICTHSTYHVPLDSYRSSQPEQPHPPFRMQYKKDERDYEQSNGAVTSLFLSLPTVLVPHTSLVPRPTPLFCSSVCVDNNTWSRRMAKMGKAWYHSSHEWHHLVHGGRRWGGAHSLFSKSWISSSSRFECATDSRRSRQLHSASVYSWAPPPVST